MSIVKSHSVGHGDMFHIEHNSDNFTIIDCCIDDGDIGPVTELLAVRGKKGIMRFISTHPDDDHIRGLDYLDDVMGIVNFYCVKNNVTKEDRTDSFDRYCQLRDDPKRHFSIAKGCSRKWMDQSDETRGSSGLSVLWPDTENEEYKAELAYAEQGGSPNNISAVLQYCVQNGATFLWMGDLETDFMEAIQDDLAPPLVDILFAPHHGRNSARVPQALLDAMEPQIVVIGEAHSEHLCYYQNFNTICQNSAGDIVFECLGSEVHVFTSEPYEVDFLENRNRNRQGLNYAGTLIAGARKRSTAA